jgi:hypothetical protein
MMESKKDYLGVAALQWVYRIIFSGIKEYSSITQDTVIQ